MIRHIVMWKLKEHAEGADRQANMQKVRQLLEDCRDCVPGMLEFEIGLASEGCEATYDVVLNSLFESREALEAYQVHPRHVASKPLMSAVRTERQCMDYELPAR
ncbi:Stress responsive A/B Barrel Domain protein [Pigmentiphaga humi]|uniref:Stress responsive A/B Barrel Domain protein n=1 Tax=Pigmentiphaga humi TaxID=2478468 RepID=A0A3P4B201_9BURK|nr:Dabb family protein [Pigmentiphaga humi]VCU69730.1 Stress responsive A/B Barrel Domain protein [Pigmentiphaga humi]